MDTNEMRLVLRDVPVLNYVLGLLFASVGACVLIVGGPLIMAVFLLVGLAFLLFSSVLTVTADRVTRTLKMDYRSVMRHSSQELYFDEIAGIGVKVSQGSKGRLTYSVVLKRKSGELVPLRSTSSSGANSKERMASRLRDFMGVPFFDSSPLGLAHEALKTYTEQWRETEGVHWIIQPVGACRWHSADFKTQGFFLCIAQKAEGQNSNGFLATLGSMMFKKLLSSKFQPQETPDLDRAVSLSPLDPMLEPHFMAFSNAPEQVRAILNQKVSDPLAAWAGRHPIRQLQNWARFGPITVLFGPGGVYVSPTDLLHPDQVEELSALGVALVKSQTEGRFRQASHI